MTKLPDALFAIGSRVRSVIAPVQHGIVTYITVRPGDILEYGVCWAEDLKGGAFSDFELEDYGTDSSIGFTEERTK